MTDTIDTVALNAKIEACQCSINIQFLIGGNCARLNIALAATVGDTSRIELATEILRVWFAGTDGQVRQIFGGFTPKRKEFGADLRTFSEPHEPGVKIWDDFSGTDDICRLDGSGELIQQCIDSFSAMIQTYRQCPPLPHR